MIARMAIAALPSREGAVALGVESLVSAVEGDEREVRGVVQGWCSLSRCGHRC